MSVDNLLVLLLWRLAHHGRSTPGDWLRGPDKYENNEAKHNQGNCSRVTSMNVMHLS
jgi:hypothetical protein